MTSEAIPYADIIILALVAGFILLRLRSVLGRKDDGGGADFFRPAPPSEQSTVEPIIQLGVPSLKPKPREEAVDPYVATLEKGTVADGLTAIKSKDAAFSATNFLGGAKMAFEMVFDAFAKGDKKTLGMLLADDIAAHFISDIDVREKQENKSETTLLSVAAKTITQATLEKNIARITVHFASEQVTVERNAAGEIVGGDPSAVHHAEDEWVFERDVTSKNPNWKVVET